MAEKDPRTVQLNRVRLSFPSLVEKTVSVQGGKEKFRANFIIDPETPQGKAAIKACEAAIGEAEMAEFKKAGVVATIDDPKRRAFRSGSKFRNAEGEIYAGYEGMVAVACNMDKRPNLRNRRKDQVAIDDIDDVFYGGVFCDAVIRFYCVSKKEQGGRGLFAQCDIIRSHQEGESFGGRQTEFDEDAFDDLDEQDDMMGEEEQTSKPSKKTSSLLDDYIPF